MTKSEKTSIFIGKKLYKLEIQINLKQLEMSQYIIVWHIKKNEKASIFTKKLY